VVELEEDSELARVRRATWARQRKARGPPRQLEWFSTVEQAEHSQLPPEVDEDFNQDPLSGLEPL